MSVSQSIKKFLHSHSRIDYAYRFFRYFNNKSFFDNATLLNRMGDGTNTNKNFLFQSFGELNPDKPLYYIKITQHDMGLLSFFTTTSHMLVVADMFGFNPVIEWNARFYTRDNDDLQSNVFEYYFNQPCGVGAAEALQSKYLTMGSLSHRLIPAIDPNGFLLKDDIIALTAPAVSKFIRLNDETHKHIETHIESALEGKKTLAIHVRGGGYKVGLCNYHPVGINPSQHIEAAKQAIETHGFERIFLATDEDDTIDLFKNAFGTMIVTHSDITRVEHGISMDLTSINFIKQGSRPDHKYFMGLEVLTDVYTMAACQGLVAGYSNVSNTALLVNGGKYEYKNMLYNGIYGYDTTYKKPNSTMSQQMIRFIKSHQIL